MVRSPLLFIAALLVLVGGSTLVFQRSLQVRPAEQSVLDSPGDDPITPADRVTILERLYELVEANYVMADTARMITASIREKDIAGAYDDITDAATFAGTLTRDLQLVNGDRHLYVNYGRSEGAVSKPQARPAAGRPAGPVALGFTRVETLDGTVGYIELGGALRQGSDQRQDHRLMAEVVSAVESADAVILDLRQSPGGSALLANLLVSHFLPPGVHLLTIDSRRAGHMEKRLTARTVPGPRRLDVPLYVLISRRSFSAAEDIAFSLQSQGRATLVGERTGGGGRNNLRTPLGHGLTISISVTRVLDPRTGQEAWERRGVVPDIETSAEDALNVALRLARDPQPD